MKAGIIIKNNLAAWFVPDPRDIANRVIQRHMMRVNVGVSVYIVDNEDTRATSVDTNRIKTKNNQSHRLGELIRQPLKAKRRKTGEQVNE